MLTHISCRTCSPQRRYDPSHLSRYEVSVTSDTWVARRVFACLPVTGHVVYLYFHTRLSPRTLTLPSQSLVVSLEHFLKFLPVGEQRRFPLQRFEGESWRTLCWPPEPNSNITCTYPAVSGVTCPLSHRQALGRGCPLFSQLQKM